MCGMVPTFHTINAVYRGGDCCKPQLCEAQGARNTTSFPILSIKKLKWSFGGRLDSFLYNFAGIGLVQSSAPWAHFWSDFGRRNGKFLRHEIP
jgi:hypothetical protein